MAAFKDMTRYAFLAAMSGLAAMAASPVDPVNKDRKGLAVKGYDVVAYFDEARPVKGSASNAHRWMGATWWFSSAENRDRFAADPAKFAPQYGGYCAWAVSQGYTAPIDPEAWKIVDGKLYLNYSKAVQQQWSRDIPERIAAGDRNWPGLHR